MTSDRLTSAPLTLGSPQSLYERIGAEGLHALLEHFYARVARDPLLAPLFPGSRDSSLWATTLEKQEAFLTGFLGGPPLYHQRYGHPRLRARHLPFPITPAHAGAWLACMRAALNETPQIDAASADELHQALSRVAVHMVNQPG
ncbi:globin [Deinococcus sonorensis]|uniref:Globin n=2 Tax=Deinococcus sonorensis TaxID=309891 RepID=A0AAU7U881_9DEIO